MNGDAIINKPSINMDDMIMAYKDEYILFIRQKLGIVIGHQLSEMIKTIKEACQKFHCNPEAYLNKLKECPDDSPLLEHLILGITIGETYFFRDKNQMNLLRNSILPELISHKRNNNDFTIRIWSAGCSSGEEIYTIAMILNDILSDIKDWTIHLIGTDINTKVLHKAIIGKYTEWSMRSIDQREKNKYFKKVSNHYLLIPEIKNQVYFFYLNLNSDLYPSMLNQIYSQDLILCRNVLIYFDYECIKHIMNRFHACLQPNGYLMLGASDPVSQLDLKKLYVINKNALLKCASDTDISAINQKPLKPESQIIPKTIKFETRPIKHKTILVHPIQSIDKKLNELIGNQQWQAVIDLIDNNITTDNKNEFLNTKALAYANLGKLDIALKITESYLKKYSTNQYAYLTHSLILSELNELNKSEQALRNAIFLDNQFVLGHFQLGLLLLRKKLISQGVKSLKNALNIATHEQNTKIVPGSQGITFGEFTETLKHEIDIYQSRIEDHEQIK